MKTGLIYFDNAATSFPKPRCVKDAVIKSIDTCGNPGRSAHALSLSSAKAIYSCRESICDFFNYNAPESIVFTHNTTYSLNLAITGLYHGGDIIISNLEHNSVYRPAARMCSLSGNRLFIFDALGSDDAVVNSFVSSITPKTKMAVITMCSNVTGKILPYKKISDICKSRGITLILDAAQYAGLVPLDLSNLYFSAICFAGHKSLYGIMGTGFVIFGKNSSPSPLIIGGNGVNSTDIVQNAALPEGLESGTAGTIGICALCAGIGYIKGIGADYIRQKTCELEREMTQKLSAIKGIRLLGSAENKVSTVIFDTGHDSEELSAISGDKGLCLRGGLHCSPLSHQSLGTLERGAVRISLSHMNTLSEVDTAAKIIEQVIKEL